MSTPNIVTSMEALMAQVKELEARASACEAAKAAAEQRAAELERTVRVLTAGMYDADLCWAGRFRSRKCRRRRKLARM